MRLLVLLCLPGLIHGQDASNRLGLKTCTSTDATQAWTLAPGGWGANYTIQNVEAAGGAGHTPWCVDVNAWMTVHVGATITGHTCCTSTKLCKRPAKNYNEQWGRDAGPATSVIYATDSLRQKALCLTTANGKTTAGTLLTLGPCASAVKWDAPSSAALLKTNGLCVGVVDAPPGPTPTPPDVRRPACVLANTTTLPFCDTSLSTTARAKDLVQRMTVPEKLVQLIGGIGGGVTPATPRLGVPAYQYHNEGLHGLRTTCKLGPHGEKLFSTMFPQVTGMAATGNLNLIKGMASHMANEARAVNNVMVANMSPFPSKVSSESEY